MRDEASKACCICVKYVYMCVPVYALRIFIVAAKDDDGKLRGRRKKIRIEGAVEKGTKRLQFGIYAAISRRTEWRTEW